MKPTGTIPSRRFVPAVGIQKVPFALMGLKQSCNDFTLLWIETATQQPLMAVDRFSETAGCVEYFFDFLGWLMHVFVPCMR